MGHLPLAEEIWPAFLIMVGVGLLIFNRRWAVWASPLTPLQLAPIAQSVKTAIGGVQTVVVGLDLPLSGLAAKKRQLQQQRGPNEDAHA
jgi:hypothetical protein